MEDQLLRWQPRRLRSQDNAAKVVAGLEAKVDCLKGCVQRLEAEAAAAAPELLAVRKDAQQKVM
jgi:hypothetical protein